ncbi:MAG: tetratricopeptide repeat protein [Anaerolineae bacterium]|nr:tetratricopeptide repeat protein [Anaerolineae bacterium]
MTANTSDLDALLQAGAELEETGTEQAVIDYYRPLVAQYPDDAQVQFRMGGAYDSAGYEAEAVVHYQRALELGLSGDDLWRVAVQLGSSLRNVGDTEGAIAILQKASVDYPDHVALRAFYALALTSAGQSQQAVVELLDVILRHPTALEAYKRSLRAYTDELRTTIKG